MTGFSEIEWIARPPNEVFDFIAASENAPKIVDSVTSMVKLTEGPPRVGTRYRETRLMNGKEQQAELEIVESNRSIATTSNPRETARALIWFVKSKREVSGN